MISRLVIIGVGLIGGSLALGLKAQGRVTTVVGVGRHEENLKLAKSLGIVDVWTTNMAEAVQDADVVVLAVPMGAYAGVFAEIAPHLKAGAIVTDAGSTKQHALNEAAKHLPENVFFVAAHPIAGTEQSGASAAFAELYMNHLCIVTPNVNTNETALSVVKDMWQSVGSEVIEMPAEEHDALLASVSHLPHVAAFSLVNAVEKQKNNFYDPFAFAAGGFRDFTRIASSSPAMWRDIALSNKSALIEQIDGLQHELSAMKEALVEEDGALLLRMFASAKQARDEWLENKAQKLGGKS